MGALTHTERQVTYALARQLGSMELATRIVETGIVTISGIHQDAAAEVTKTLTIAESMVKSATHAGRMTPEKRTTLARHTKDYMDDVLRITDDAAGQIIDILLTGP